MDKTEIQQINKKLDMIIDFQKRILHDISDNHSLLDELSAKVKKISDKDKWKST